MPSLRWVRPEGIHATLEFLGATPEDRVPDIKRALAGCAETVAPFDLTPLGVGSFGGRNVRVIWIGLGGDEGALSDLAESVERALEPLGFDREQRDFNAHITLARVRNEATPQDRARLHDALGRFDAPQFPTFRVGEFVLMQSILGEGGAHYRPLATFRADGRVTPRAVWYDRSMPDTIEVLIEIPRGSRNKYEWDDKRGVLRLDRTLYSSVHYPTDYGYIPNTHADDGDHLDVLVIVEEPTLPGCYLDARPIGVLRMRDDKGGDDKIICVPVADPRFADVREFADIASHWQREIEQFFRTYKALQGLQVDIYGWGDRAQAWQIIEAAQAAAR